MGDGGGVFVCICDGNSLHVCVCVCIDGWMDQIKTRQSHKSINVCTCKLVLNVQGMVVLDSALGETWSRALRAEIQHLAQVGKGCMQPNRTRFGPWEVGL